MQGPLSRTRFQLGEEGEGKRILLLIEQGISKGGVGESWPLGGLGE